MQYSINSPAGTWHDIIYGQFEFQLSIVIDILKLALLSCTAVSQNFVNWFDQSRLLHSSDDVGLDLNNSQTLDRPCCMYACNRNSSNALISNIMIIPFCGQGAFSLCH